MFEILAFEVIILEYVGLDFGDGLCRLFLSGEMKHTDELTWITQLHDAKTCELRR